MGVVLFVALLGGCLSAVVAASKNRSAPIWFVFGALFPLITFIAALCVPRVQRLDDAVMEVAARAWRGQVR